MVKCPYRRVYESKNSLTSNLNRFFPGSCQEESESIGLGTG
jgi:hypothetical protein